MKLFVIIGFLACLSCSAIQSNNERGHYAEARRIMLEALSPETIERCGLDIEEPIPAIVAVDHASAFLGGASGRYYPQSRTIYYAKGAYSSIVHEATHDLLAYKTKECIHEVAAHYAERISALTEQNRKLRRIYANTR